MPLQFPRKVGQSQGPRPGRFSAMRATVAAKGRLQPNQIPQIANFYGFRGQKWQAINAATFNWLTSWADASTFASIDATGGRNGTPCVKIQATAVGSSFAGWTSTGQRKVVLFGWFKPNQAPTGATAVILQATGPAGSLGTIGITTAGILQAKSNVATANYSGTLTMGNWYYVCCKIDYSQTPFTVAWSVYDETRGLWTDEGTLIGNGADTPADVASVRFGQMSATAQWGDVSNVGARFQDIGYSVRQEDYPIKPVEVNLLVPSSVGAHSLGSGAFTKTGSVAITGADTTSYQEIDEIPTSAADWVAQTGIDAAAYVEYDFPALANTVGVPLAVRAYAELQGTSVNPYQAQVVLNDGVGNTADITSPSGKSGTTVADLALTLPTTRDGSNWSVGAVNNLRLRFGFSGDVTPNPQLNTAFLEVLQPIAVTVAPVNVNVTDTGIGTDATSSLKIALVDSGAGTDVSTLHASLPRTDSGAATDVVTNRVLVKTETGTGADAITNRTLVKTETGTGTDVSSLHVALPRTDSGTGTDVVTNRAIKTTDSGAGTDVVTNRVIVKTDSGAGTDASSLHVALPRTDTGTGTDAITNRRVALVDSGTGTDFSAKINRVTDTGTGTDVSSLHVSLPRSDTATGTDVITNRTLVKTEAGTGTDAITNRVIIKTEGLAGTAFIGQINIFEGGVSGVSITTGNSGAGSGTAFTAVNGTAAKYTTAQAAHGAVSATILQANGASATPWVSWTGLGAVTSQTFGRVYYRFDSIPTQTVKLLELRTSAPASCGGLKMNVTTGFLVAQNAAGGAIGSSSPAVPLNQWIRVEYRLVPSTTVGELEYRVWFNADSTGTPDWTSNNTGQVLGADFDGVRVGIPAWIGAASADWNMWFDDVNVLATTWPGPYVYDGTDFTSAKTTRTTDTATGTDIKTNRVIVVTDSGLGTDVKSNRVILTTDTGTGTDKVTNRVIVKTDSGTDTEISLKVIQATDTGTGTDKITNRTLVKTESGVGTDAITNRTIVKTETGTATDSSSEHVSLSRTDTCTGTDASTRTARAADTGTATDASSLHASLPRTDTGTGTDFISNRTIVKTDTGTGTDKVTNRAVVLTDSCTGSDKITNRSATKTESGTGTDAITTRKVVLTDTGTGSDRITNRTMVKTESGTGSDSSSLHASLSRTDTCTGTDVSHPTRTATDTGTATDKVSNRKVTLVDSGIGTDVSQAIGNNSFHGNDSGTGTEKVTNRSIKLTDSGTATDKITNRSATKTDIGTATDARAVSAHYAGSDSGADTATSSLHASILRPESGSATDFSLGANHVTAIQTGTGTETRILLAHINRVDTATDVETVRFLGNRSLTVKQSAIGNDHIALGASVPLIDAGFGFDVGVSSDLSLRHRPHPPVPPGVDESYYYADNFDRGTVISGGYPSASES